MSAPETYDDIRDDKNRKWTCSIDKTGFYKSVNIIGSELYIGYGCFDEAGHEFRQEVEIYLGDHPRLDSQIAEQLQKAVSEY